MLSKEEISKLKINVFNQCDDETIRLVAEMLKHTEQLESDKQKLIEKLEEDIKKDYHIEEIIGDKYIAIGARRHPVKKHAKEILKIVKGENQVTVK